MRPRRRRPPPAPRRPRAPRCDRQALERELAAILRQHGLPADLRRAAGPDRDPATVVALAETRVLEVQESKSKPDRGVVTVETKGFNQDGKEVCFFRRRVMVWKRDALPTRERPYDGQDVWGS